MATAYAIVHGQRVTLTIQFVTVDDQTVDVVKQLRQRLIERGLRPGVIYFDKGFASVPVFNYLRRARQPSLIACSIRGKKGGTCKVRKSSGTD